MDATIVDLRYRMKDVLKAIDRGEEVTVLYHGRKKARLVPITDATSLPDVREQNGFGIWKDRRDLQNVGEHVRRIRRSRFSDL